MLSRLARAAASGSRKRITGRSAVLVSENATHGVAQYRLCRPEQAQAQPSVSVCNTAWLSTSTDPPSTDANAAGQVSGDRLAILFTCNQCQARSMRSFSRRAYENGVVIVQCPGCDVRHLVADRLGWFGKPGSVEDFLRQRGQDVQWSAADGSLEMTMEDAKAWAQMSQEQATKAKPAQGNSEVDATSPGKHR